jgi:hypothetical protein
MQSVSLTRAELLERHRPPALPIPGGACSSCGAPWRYLGGVLQVGHQHVDGCAKVKPIDLSDAQHPRADGPCSSCRAPGHHHVRGGAAGGELRLFCADCDTPARRAEATNEWLRLGGAGVAARARVRLLEAGLDEIRALAASRRPNSVAELLALLQQVDHLATLFTGGAAATTRRHS